MAPATAPVTASAQAMALAPRGCPPTPAPAMAPATAPVTASAQAMALAPRGCPPPPAAAMTPRMSLSLRGHFPTLAAAVGPAAASQHEGERTMRRLRVPRRGEGEKTFVLLAR